MFSFQKRYFTLFVLLFLTEVLIALYVHDKFVRPYVGDFLVVMVLYCGAKSFIKGYEIPVAVGVLLFAYFIEFLQYLNFVKWIGLQHSKIANVIIGNYFTWVDIIAYTLGVITIILIEINFKKKVKARV